MKLATLIQKAIELEEDYGHYDVMVNGHEIEDLGVYPNARRVEIETKRKVEIGYVGDSD